MGVEEEVAVAVEATEVEGVAEGVDEVSEIVPISRLKLRFVLRRRTARRRRAKPG